MKRYVIVGAGAVGGILGSQLYEAGAAVLLVARGAHYERLADEGLTYVRPDGTRRLAIPVVDNPARVDLDPEDVVVVSTKSQDTEAALDGLPLAEDSPIVCFQNGVANEAVALRRTSRVFGGFVYCPAFHLHPGEVRAFGDPVIGIFDLGRFPHGPDPLADAVAADLTSAGLSSRAHGEITPWKFGKLLNNLNNALDLLFPVHDDGSVVARNLQSEGRATLAAAGIAWTELDELHARGLPTASPAMLADQPYFNSSWQSVARSSGAVETDYLNGEIVRLGRLHGVPTPYNAVVQRFCREIASGTRGLGSCSEGDFLCLAGG